MKGIIRLEDLDSLPKLDHSAHIRAHRRRFESDSIDFDEPRQDPRDAYSGGGYIWNGDELERDQPGGEW